MELKEFIKATVSSISGAIEDINTEMSGKVIANPNNIAFYGDNKNMNRLVYPIKSGEHAFKDARLIQELEFDLMVAESNNKTKDGGVNLNVISGGINKSTTTDNTNRVKFSIPVVFLK